MSNINHRLAAWMRSRAASAATDDWAALWRAQAALSADVGAAKAEFERLASSEAPDVASAANASLGDIFFGNAEYEQALTAYERAVAREPNSVTYAAGARAATLIALRRYDVAAEEYRRLVFLLHASDAAMAEMLFQDIGKLADVPHLKSVAVDLMRAITSRTAHASTEE